jgi:hypothetical protein
MAKATSRPASDPAGPATTIETEPTPERMRDYLAAGGGQCLFCQSPQIAGGSYDYETPELGQKVTCLVCGRSWVDVYVLTRVEVRG